ncbi:sigma factor-like helix-turn-helix DNA-binding protein [Streptomyces sp. NPDC053493]|uniref:sigma factor-like helix-turn-helix DNA-binding protein n=1 Tax=Streptomyces sp. NPDC053493 TaxID=3365705 RepID=UPI0037D64E60
MSPTSPSVSLPSPKERRRLREALSLSEDQVAEALGVTRATVRAWETGRSSPRGRKREAYAKLLGCYEEPTSSRAEKPARPAPAATRPRPAAKGAARPPKSPKPPQVPEERLKPVAATAGGPVADTADGPAPGARRTATATARRPGGARERAATPSDATARAETGARGPAGGEIRATAGAGDATGAPGEAASAGSAAGADAHPPHGAQPVRPAVAVGGPGAAEAPAPEPEPDGGDRPYGLTPEQAFDALYAYVAPGLVHQTYLLTGRRRLSRESVEYAFHHAWQHWPEVAVDRDPVGWVRAAAYEYALSPWHRFRRRHRHPDSPPTEASRRALLAALLELPPPYRRTVLLYDGLGLDLPETAAETEASTPAAGNRLLHARTVIGQRVPELADPEVLHERLSCLVAEAPTATLPPARSVRSGSERRIRLLTRAVFGVTAVLIGLTAFTVVTAPTRYIPVNAPGAVVEGVPVRGGPQKLDAEDKELHDRLRTAPHPGPERLVPTVR